MAKNSSSKEGGTGTGEDWVPKTSVMVNGGRIETGAQGFDGVSFEKGYPRTSIINNNRNSENEKVFGTER